jgi:hypothetical protein
MEGNKIYHFNDQGYAFLIDDNAKTKKSKRKLIKELKGTHPFAMLQSCGEGGEDGIESVIVRLLMHHHMGMVSLLSLGNANLA